LGLTLWINSAQAILFPCQLYALKFILWP
jgi:hypothetical protein